MKLTNRDKTLLTVLVLAIVWALGVMFVIKPKINDVSSKNAELKDVQEQLVVAQQAVESAKTIKEDCNTALKSAQEGAQNFFDIPKAYEAEQYLTKVLAGDANGNGKIDISSLSINGPSAASLSTYSPSVSQGISGVPVIDSATLVTGTTTETVTSSAGETLGCYNYTVSFKARRADLMKFLTNIKATENGNSLIVTSLSISDNNVPDTDYLEGSMGFSLYFVQKLDGSDIDEVIENQTKALEEASQTE